MVKGVGHLGQGEAMEAGGREFSLHGRVVKGVGHLGRVEAMRALYRSLAACSVQVSSCVLCTGL